jgi:long-subunit fatty acid transport protein
MKLDIVNYGVSIAHRFPGGLAIGGGVALSDFSIDSRVAVFLYTPDVFAIPASTRGNFTGLGQAYGPVNFAESNVVADIVETGEDKGVAFNFGALVRPAGKKWSAGGSVRINPEFQYRSASTWGDAQPVVSARGQLIFPAIEDVAFKVPDVYSVGGAYRPTDRFLFAAQYDRVQFSQLSRNLRDVNGEDGGEAHQAVITGLKNPDSNQMRFGTEYASVRGMRVLSLRLGTAYESAHTMFYTQTTPTRFARLEALYRPDAGQWHVTPGFGIAVPKVQFDAGVDLSRRTRTVSLSAVYRF